MAEHQNNLVQLLSTFEKIEDRADESEDRSDAKADGDPDFSIVDLREMVEEEQTDTIRSIMKIVAADPRAAIEEINRHQYNLPILRSLEILTLDFPNICSESVIEKIKAAIAVHEEI